jgi:hypothetical protein
VVIVIEASGGERHPGSTFVATKIGTARAPKDQRSGSFET